MIFLSAILSEVSYRAITREGFFLPYGLMVGIFTLHYALSVESRFILPLSPLFIILTCIIPKSFNTSEVAKAAFNICTIMFSSYMVMHMDRLKKIVFLQAREILDASDRVFESAYTPMFILDSGGRFIRGNKVTTSFSVATLTNVSWF